MIEVTGGMKGVNKRPMVCGLKKYEVTEKERIEETIEEEGTGW